MSTSEERIEEFSGALPFSPDPFQRAAITEIAEGRSVLVCAPTGAGKTLVAEFAIEQALAERVRLVYTTPLKALSNQKFADFCERWGEPTVGLLTGDISVNPHAPILVMTTEILRNLFWLRPMEGLGYVVLDECHYLGNEGRGTVWEELIILCPTDVRLVALSATVGNARELAAWITEVHGPITPIIEQHRPVPLTYLGYDPRQGVVPASAFKEGRLVDRERPWLVPPMRSNRVVADLQERGWLPALYFIFSRAGCREAVRRFLHRGPQLITPEERDAVDEAIAALREEPAGQALESTLSELCLEGLRHGVSMHHAGILPPLKRLTERLFERGLVKVVFATETMSLGIHMPAKAVVIESLRKRSDVGFRTLTALELIQMAGRAGRRGIDPQGFCLIGLGDPTARREAGALLHRSAEPIRSRFRLGYGSCALLILRYGRAPDIQHVLDRSFGQYQHRQQLEDLETQQAATLAELAPLRSYQAPCGDFGNFGGYRTRVQALEEARVRLTPPRRRRRQRRGGRASLSADARAELAPLETAVGSWICHPCPHRPACAPLDAERRRLERRLAGDQTRAEQLRLTYWDQFQRLCGLLEHVGYLKDGALSTEGRFMAELRHDNELLVTRAVFSPLLHGLDAASIGAVLACLLEDGRPGEAVPIPKRYRSLERRARELGALVQQTEQLQRRFGIGLPLPFQLTPLLPTVRWAEGRMDWAALVESLPVELDEGDLVRLFRRLIDLARQLLDAPGLPEEIQPKLPLLIAGLDRDVVLASALL
ncbi:MAG: DEAD/DEAH box helicase [Deltaproteobacteria bacterium]|nr:DEAD/DEAH box helicase [Deltaproteobacteria bacterium]